MELVEAGQYLGLLACEIYRFAADGNGTGTQLLLLIRILLSPKLS